MAVLIFLLSACRTPVSNLPFAQEAEFLATLPAASTWNAPSEVVRAPVGNDPVLGAAKVGAAEWAGWVEGPVKLGEALRDREPDVRSDVARRWELAEVAANYSASVLLDDRPRTVWVSAEVVAVEGGTFIATVSVAEDEQGTLVEVGVMERDGATIDASWDLDALYAVYGVEVRPGTLEVSVTQSDRFEGARELDATVGSGPDDATFRIVDLNQLTFGADLAITEDGEEWPAAIAVTVDPEVGGRADGVVFQGTAELSFDACWDAGGATQFLGGDDGVRTTGAAASCSVQ